MFASSLTITNNNMTTQEWILNCKRVAYRNASINRKTQESPQTFYRKALETIRYYKNSNSHNVPTIQAYCNLMGYSTY
jgi:hypothetical protein